MKNVKFSSGDYKKFSNLKNIIYCDPPYRDTKCHYIEKFDHKDFYDWCNKMSHNNIIFLREYKAPKQFKKIMSITNKLTGISPSLRN